MTVNIVLQEDYLGWWRRGKEGSRGQCSRHVEVLHRGLTRHQSV